MNFQNMKLSLFIVFTFVCQTILADSSYLEPFGPICPENDLIMRSLLGKREKSAQHLELYMLASPWRGKEHALIIEKEYQLGPTHDPTNILWTIEHVLAQEKIKIPRNYSVDNPPQVEVVRRRISIDDDFAHIIETAWVSIVKHTRYWDKPYFTLDGTTYMFKAGSYHGYTTSPKEGPPLMLVELGLKLEEFAKSEEINRETTKQQCIELAKKIINRNNPNQHIDLTVKTPVE